MFGPATTAEPSSIQQASTLSAARCIPSHSCHTRSCHTRSCHTHSDPASMQHFLQRRLFRLAGAVRWSQFEAGRGRARQGRAGQGQNLRPLFGVDALRWSRFQAIEIDVNHGRSDLAEEHSGRRRDGDGAMRYAPGRTGTAHPVETEGVNLSGEQPALWSCWPDTALCRRGSRRENCSSNTPVRWVGGGLPEAEIGTVAALGRGATTSVSVKPGVS